MTACIYCLQEFSTLPNLYAHQRKAKYCIKIQEDLKKEKTVDKRTCEACEKTFPTVTNLNRHKKICTEYISLNIKRELLEQYEKRVQELKDLYENQIKELKEREKEYLAIINKKDETVERLANKKTNVNNGVIYNNTINLIPLTDKHLLEKAQKITPEHMKSAHSMGSFIGSELLDNVCAVTDKARRIFAYVDKNNIPKKDNIEILMPKVIYPMVNMLTKRNEEAISICDIEEKKEKEEINNSDKLNKDKLTQDVTEKCCKQKNAINALRDTMNQIANGKTIVHPKIKNTLYNVVTATTKGKDMFIEGVGVQTTESIENTNTVEIVNSIENTNTQTIENTNDVQIINTENTNDVQTINTDDTNDGYTKKYIKDEDGNSGSYIFVKLQNNRWVDKNNTKYHRSRVEEDYSEDSSEYIESKPVVQPPRLTEYELYRKHPPEIDKIEEIENKKPKRTKKKYKPNETPSNSDDEMSEANELSEADELDEEDNDSNNDYNEDNSMEENYNNAKEEMSKTNGEDSSNPHLEIESTKSIQSNELSEEDDNSETNDGEFEDMKYSYEYKKFKMNNYTSEETSETEKNKTIQTIQTVKKTKK
jgi:hypothetical protein